MGQEAGAGSKQDVFGPEDGKCLANTVPVSSSYQTTFTLKKKISGP